MSRPRAQVCDTPGESCLAPCRASRNLRRTLNEDTFQFAIENTEVIRAPERRIATFGETTFQFHLVAEHMDSTDQVRIRAGWLHAERPQILAPEYLRRTLMEGFGERAESFVNWLRENSSELALLKYGFQLRKTDVTEWTVTRPIEAVVADLKADLEREEDPLRAIVLGTDEGWEVCLLKFATDLIEESAGDNLRDFKRRGLF